MIVQAENSINGELINNNSNNPAETKIESLSTTLQPLSIELDRDIDTIEFIMKAKGYPFLFCRGNSETKIGTIIEYYINKINGKDDIKNTFVYNDNLIKNLDISIGQLGIKNLSIISSSCY